jgi:hypothetical protein
VAELSVQGRDLSIAVNALAIKLQLIDASSSTRLCIAGRLPFIWLHIATGDDEASIIKDGLPVATSDDSPYGWTRLG